MTHVLPFNLFDKGVVFNLCDVMLNILCVSLVKSTLSLVGYLALAFILLDVSYGNTFTKLLYSISAVLMLMNLVTLLGCSPYG